MLEKEENFALLTLNRILIKKAGLTQPQADALLAQFLQQEAKRYIETVEQFDKLVVTGLDVPNLS